MLRQASAFSDIYGIFQVCLADFVTLIIGGEKLDHSTI